MSSAEETEIEAFEQLKTRLALKLNEGFSGEGNARFDYPPLVDEASSADARPDCVRRRAKARRPV